MTNTKKPLLSLGEVIHLQLSRTNARDYIHDCQPLPLKYRVPLSVREIEKEKI